jgi:glyoxylase-like metal-dependent hydrolase (beta-lactamase superfamily II)
MSLQVRRLHLATMLEEWPVHGYLVTHPGGAVLVDTGVGGPQQVLADHRVVNRSVADALDEHDMTPGDIDLAINTHLHFDHCGQNAVYKHRQYLEPDDGDLPPGQASDPAAWRESVGRVHALRPDRVHFCHDTEVVHS